MDLNDPVTKRNWELMGRVMGIFFKAGYRPTLDHGETSDCPESPTIKLIGERFTVKLEQELSRVLQDAGFTTMRYHIRPGGSPSVHFHSNAQGELVGIERNISGDAPGYFRISIGS